jgi:PIN domain nuclease of toxin-antitoxin system
VDLRPVRVISDTHSLVWALTEPGLLGTEARRAIAEGNVIASAANLWELCLIARKKGSLLANPVAWWTRYIEESGITTLPIRASHVMALGALAEIHKDPFDRILVAQSIVEKLPLVTKDAHLAKYGIETIW